MTSTSNGLNSLKLKIMAFVSFGYYDEEQKERNQWANAEICETSLLVIIFCFLLGIRRLAGAVRRTSTAGTRLDGTARPSTWRPDTTTLRSANKYKLNRLT
jgi:hypothetical protein